MTAAGRQVDLNLDLGEGFGIWSKDSDEDELLGLATSVNLACGFHAGDPGRMRQAVQSAARRGVAVGAHPGLPDLLGFGRRPMRLSPGEVSDYITYQIGALSGFTGAAGLELHHVKLHGELAIQCNREEAAARAYVTAVAAWGGELPIYANRHSLVWTVAAELGVPAVAEFYADLPLRRDGSRVPANEERPHGRHPGATADYVRARVRDFLTTGSVAAHDGGRIDVAAGTISVHTDETTTVGIVESVRAAVQESGYELSADLR
jgi:5-oxoprolinase (ATP-hydrolysing) subunit A